MKWRTCWVPRGSRCSRQASEGLRLTSFHGVFVRSGDRLGRRRRRHSGPRMCAGSCRSPRVLGLAEVMDIPAVLAAAPEVLEKMQAAISAGAPVDGHAAGLAARDLIAYAAAGIRSDHESTTVEEARAAGRAGHARPGARGLECPESRYA